MRHIPIVTLILLASCGQPTDDHKFAAAEFERRSQPVTVVEHTSLADLRAAAPPAAKVKGRDLYGFSYIRPAGCEIHVTELRRPEARLWLGHEMTHCVYGRWHD